jgi:hypothetical protein
VSTPRPDPTDIRYFNQVMAQIRALLAEARRAITIDATTLEGDLTVDGGTVEMISPLGQTQFLLGPMEQGDRGLEITRENGVLAIAMRKEFPSDIDQRLDMRDRFDNLILSEGVFLAGLERPYMALPMQPVIGTAGTAAPTYGPNGWERTNGAAATGTWVPAYRCTVIKQNAFARFRFQCRVSGGATGGVRVVEIPSGNVLGVFLGGAWTGTFTSATDVEVASPGLQLPGTYDTPITIEVQVARTVGAAGTVTCSVTQSMGGGA